MFCWHYVLHSDTFKMFIELEDELSKRLWIIRFCRQLQIGRTDSLKIHLCLAELRLTLIFANVLILISRKLVQYSLWNLLSLSEEKLPTNILQTSIYPIILMFFTHLSLQWKYIVVQSNFVYMQNGGRYTVMHYLFPDNPLIDKGIR